MSIKISDLPLAAQVVGEEMIEVVQGGVSKQMPLDVANKSSELQQINQAITSVENTVGGLQESKVDSQTYLQDQQAIAQSFSSLQLVVNEKVSNEEHQNDVQELSQGIQDLEINKVSTTVYDQKMVELMNALEQLQEDLSNIPGTDPTIVPRLTSLEEYVQKTNRNPIANPDLADITDAVLVQTGNLLLNDNDPDNDTFTVSMVDYAGTARTLSTVFYTAYGSMVVLPNGNYTFTLSDAARALVPGQNVTETFSYKTVDSRNASSYITTLQILIRGTNNGPVVVTDNAAVQPGGTVSGNVLTNDSDPEGDPLSVVNFSIVGFGTHTVSNTPVVIPNIGELTVRANGTWTFLSYATYYGMVPLITYYVTDGTTTSPGNIVLSVSKPSSTYQETINWFLNYYTGNVAPVNIAPNPVTSRPTRTWVNSDVYPPWDYSLSMPDRSAADGTNLDFRVGPGKEYTEINQLPLNGLKPGDRVFIYHRAQPYKFVIPIHVRGDAFRWIEFIGVKGANGELPVLDGDGAVEDPNICIFNPTHNSNSMISIIQPLGVGAPNNYKPGYIHIHGFEIKNVNDTFRRTNYLGEEGSWYYFVQGIRILGGDHITISGCHLHNNGNGIFANSTPDLGERMWSRYIHILFNYFASNGKVGNSSVHNCYTEAFGTIHEFNYYDPLIEGAWGDILKDRSTGHVFRYNYFNANNAANCISIREPDATWNAVQNTAYNDAYGTRMYLESYIYGNIFNMHESTTIIGHGDGFQSAHNLIRYNGRLFFYSNRIYGHYDAAGGGFNNQGYEPFRINMLEFWNTNSGPTEPVMVNNLVHCEKKTVSGMQPIVGIFAYGGTASVRSSNNRGNSIVATAIYSDSAQRDDVQVLNHVSFKGTLEDQGWVVDTTTDFKFADFANDDFEMDPTSPFFTNQAVEPAEAVSRQLTFSGEPVYYPFNKRPAPQATTPSSISGSPVVNHVLTAHVGNFKPTPDTLGLAWLRDGNLIAEQDGYTYTTTEADVGHYISLRIIAENDQGQSIVETAALLIVSSNTPQNLTAPVVSGSLQVTHPMNCTPGTWDLAVDHYAFQWFMNDTIEVAGATTNTHSAGSGEVGNTFKCRVRAYNADGEYGEIFSNTVTAKAIGYDPEYNGKYNFSAVSGTGLKNLDSKWKANLLFGSYDPLDYLYCDGNGRLVGSYVATYNNGWAWYENGQGDNQKVQFSWVVADNNGYMLAGTVRRSSTQNGYALEMNEAGNYTLFRNDVSVQTGSVTALTIGERGTIRVEINGGVIDVYYESGNAVTYPTTLLFTYTDSSPLTGGFPGLGLNPGGAQTQGFDYWWDTPTP